MTILPPMKTEMKVCGFCGSRGIGNWCQRKKGVVSTLDPACEHFRPHKRKVKSLKNRKRKKRRPHRGSLDFDAKLWPP